MSLIISPVCNLTLQLKDFKPVDPPDVLAAKILLQVIHRVLFGYGRPCYAQTPSIGGVLLEDIVKARGIVSRHNPLYKHS
jgi:hypothetical protein